MIYLAKLIQLKKNIHSLSFSLFFQKNICVSGASVRDKIVFSFMPSSFIRNRQPCIPSDTINLITTERWCKKVLKNYLTGEPSFSFQSMFFLRSFLYFHNHLRYRTSFSVPKKLWCFHFGNQIVILWSQIHYRLSLSNCP